MACDCKCACDECGEVRHAISGHPLPSGSKSCSKCGLTRYASDFHDGTDICLYCPKEDK